MPMNSSHNSKPEDIETSCIPSYRKIILVGCSGVGKTAFIQRYVYQRFSPSLPSTIGVDYALKVIELSDDLKIGLQFWDIPGQEHNSSVSRILYRGARACVVVFDVTNKESFYACAKWKEDIDSKCSLSDGTPIPCLLLANKCDLPGRQVDKEDIEAFCDSHKFFSWREISLKENRNVTEAVGLLIEEINSKLPEDTLLSSWSSDEGSISLNAKEIPSKSSFCNC